MGSIARRPTPSGAITHLFDRLHELHLNAGEPSLRRIVAGIGRGEVSLSTVYNTLAGPRVPAWGFLELIVARLGGDPEEFRSLWSAARLAERGPAPASVPPRTPPADPGVRSPVVWSPAVPLRDPAFGWRITELRLLHDRLNRTSPRDSRIQVIHGPAGVGKTELVMEYARRYRGDYDVIWFVKAEYEHLVRESLIELGRRIQLHDLRDGHSDHLVATTIRALRTGVPYSRLLVILDDAARPEIVLRYLADTAAHILVTAQSNGWHHLPDIDVLDLREFSHAQAVEYLACRAPGLTMAEIPELAVATTGLPLALDLTAACLRRTGLSASAYLHRFRQQTLAMLDPDTDFSYPQAVAVCLALTQDAMSSGATALLRLLAMISPEPIAEELLVQPSLAERLAPELRDVLADTLTYRRTVEELAQFSLVRLYRVRYEARLHRLVQSVVARFVVRDDPAAEARLRHSVHLLLTGSDPGTPELEEHNAAFDRSYPHLVHAGAVTSELAALRDLIIGQVRRLHLRGRVAEAHGLAYPTVRTWRQRLGEDHLHTLQMAAELGVVLRLLGDPGATELTLDTLRRLIALYGTHHPVSLICARNHSTDLRFLGRYEEAQRRDEKLLPCYADAFGESGIQTLNLLNNIALGYRILGRYEEALLYDERAYKGRLRTFGPAHLYTLDSRFAKARDLRRLGRYEESHSELVEILRLTDTKGEPRSLFDLLHELDLSVSLRRIGDHEEALNHGEATLELHHTLVGSGHVQSLSAATNLVIDRAITGDLAGARTLGDQTVSDWTELAGPDHPNTLVALANLAIVLRLTGNVAQAHDANIRALAGLTDALGTDHPHRVAVLGNLASDATALGTPDKARHLGDQALELSRRIHGPQHPITLAISANLALNLASIADPTAPRLSENTLQAYRAALPPEHPEIQAVIRRDRINLDIEIDHT
jgi:tetratricopeptide (TPR) repeat protein